MFFISGLWHGAAFTVILWGCIHGLFYIIEILVKQRFPKIKAPALIGWIYLITIHTLALTVFRALSLADVKIIFNHLFFNFNGTLCVSELRQVADLFFIVVCLLVCGLLFVKEIIEEFNVLQKASNVKRLVKPVFYILILVSLFVLGNFNANQFIYFQF